GCGTSQRQGPRAGRRGCAEGAGGPRQRRAEAAAAQALPGLLLPPPRKGKGCSTAPRGKRPAASASCASPLRLSAWQQQHLAPAGEGCATPCTTSCTTLYGGDFPGHPDLPARSPVGRCTRVEELLRDDQWASPVPRPLDKASPRLEKEPPRRDWQEPCDSSHSLPRRKPRKGDPQVSLQDLTDKRYEDLIPARDKKIAALMLARHQEEEEMKDRQLQVSDAWDKMRRKEKQHKARAEKERQYQLVDSLDQWQRDRDQRKAKLRLEEQQLLAARERDVMLRDKKWKNLNYCLTHKCLVYKHLLFILKIYHLHL
uniref:Coiled-coil domain containing 185 n=1 Tax=Podarcis muralis TaxID=64176 RepID=A0A670HXD2_PODMU